MLYKAVIKPRSQFATSLTSDSLFGAFCWAYRHLNGEDLLEEYLIPALLEGDEQLVFSNAFPEGMLPYTDSEFKGFDKFITITDMGDKKDITRCDKKSSGIVESMYTRKTRTSTIDTVVYNYEGNFDIYIYTTLGQKEFESVLKLMFELGFGAQRSNGKGYFELIVVTKADDLLKFEGCNHVLMLSNFVPQADNPSKGVYQIQSRLPHSANGQVKTPVVQIKAGAYFSADVFNTVYGLLYKEPQVVNSVSNYMSIGIPVRI